MTAGTNYIILRATLSIKKRICVTLVMRYDVNFLLLVVCVMSVSSVMWNGILIFVFCRMVVHCVRVCFSACVNGVRSGKSQFMAGGPL
jgi:hypothetical protein